MDTRYGVFTDQHETEPKPTPPPVSVTRLQHPALPKTASLIEKIVLPTAFSLIMALISDPTRAQELQDFMTPVRDALNQVYPPQE